MIDVVKPENVLNGRWKKFVSHFSDLSQHILIMLHKLLGTIDKNVDCCPRRGSFNHVLLWHSRTMGVTKIFLFVSIFVAKNNLELTAAKCKGKCELSKLSHGHYETGIKNRAMVGHSFRNFTLPRTYDCHVKCFDETCRCQAFQISGQRCELLD